MLWVDKYRPHALDKFVLHSDIAANLKKLAASGDFPHTLFYGPPGAGKKTLIMAVLREVYGPGAEKIKVETRPWTIELPSRKLEVELTVISSNYHVELNPSDVGSQDRYVVQEVIKELAKNRPLDVAGNKGFKVLLLNEVDKLSREAQQSLRRTMEKYSAGCRLIMVANNISRVMEPVRSRCLCVRVPAPSHMAVQDQLALVAKKEGFSIPGDLGARVAVASARNLRRALLMLEVAYVQHGSPLPEDTKVNPPDWEMYIAEIAHDMVSEQTPKRLLQVRGKLYELLGNCIPSELIMRTLVTELLKKLDDELKVQVVQQAAFYEHRLQEGQKPIFHLEAFVAKFMMLYKTWMVEQFA